MMRLKDRFRSMPFEVCVLKHVFWSMRFEACVWGMPKFEENLVKFSNKFLNQSKHVSQGAPSLQAI